MKYQVGDYLPDIRLRDEENKELSLAQFRGRKVILSFHPLAFTPVCARQMLDLEANSSTFNDFDTVVIGVSVDSPFSKSAWKKELGVKNVLFASDFSKKSSEALEILRPEGFSERVVYVLNENGQVIFAKQYPLGQVPEINGILAALQSK